MHMRSIAAWLSLVTIVAGCEKPAPNAAPPSSSAPTAPAPSAVRPAAEPPPSQPPTARPSADPVPSPPAQVVMNGGVPSPFDSNGQRRTCAQLGPREGFDCVETPNGPVHVVRANAPDNVDPCAGTACLPNTRCETVTVNVGGSARRLPHCVPTGRVENVVPSRNPCAGYLCPLGYECTAPADAPYCQPRSNGA